MYKPWVKEDELVAFNLAVVSVLGIALTIVVGTKGALYFLNLGFVVYFGISLGLLLSILGHTLNIISVPTTKLAERRREVEKDFKDEAMEKELEEYLKAWHIERDPHMLELERSRSSWFASVLVFFLFVPIPWILAANINEALLARNSSDVWTQMVISAVFGMTLLLAAKVLARVLPWNETMPSSSAYVGARVLVPSRIIALDFITIAYLRVEFQLPVDLFYVILVLLSAVCFIIGLETIWFGVFFSPLLEAVNVRVSFHKQVRLLLLIVALIAITVIVRSLIQASSLCLQFW